MERKGIFLPAVSIKAPIDEVNPILGNNFTRSSFVLHITLQALLRENIGVYRKK